MRRKVQDVLGTSNWGIQPGLALGQTFQFQSFCVPHFLSFDSYEMPLYPFQNKVFLHLNQHSKHQTQSVCSPPFWVLSFQELSLLFLVGELHTNHPGRLRILFWGLTGELKVSVLLRPQAQRALRGCSCWDHSCHHSEEAGLSMETPQRTAELRDAEDEDS